MTKTLISVLSLTLVPFSVFASELSDNAKSACVELGTIQACGTKTTQYEAKLIDYIRRISNNADDYVMNESYCGASINTARNITLADFRSGRRNMKDVCKDTNKKIKKLITNL